MVSVLMVAMVVSMLAASMMYVAMHDQTTSAHDRSWGQALHVAESGVQDAIAALQNSHGVIPIGTISANTAGGSYQYRVTILARNRYQIDATGTVGSASTTSSTRRLRVTLAPPVSFAYALFSSTDITTHNNNLVCGDVWSNTSVIVDTNDAVRASSSASCPTGTATARGDVTAATGFIQMNNGSTIEGNAWSGGYDSSGASMNLGPGTTIGGNATASDGTPSCTDDITSLRYKIGTSGTITGSATAWGAITSSVAGTTSPLKCTPAPATKPMPTLTYNAANYPSGTMHEYNFPADYAAFNAYIAGHNTGLSGTFYIAGGGAAYPVTLNGVVANGDLTILADTSPIDASGGLDATVSADTTIVLASWYTASASTCTTTGGNPSDCAIGFKNNFDMRSGSLSTGDNVGVLLYAPNGPVAFKNSAEFHGAVVANNIQVNNSMNLTYDPRVGQIVGFGATTLDVALWLECVPGPVATTSC